MRVIGALVMAGGLAGAAVSAQDRGATVEDQLRLQVVILQTQLAQALAAGARCEVEGPQAAKLTATANAAAQALVASLEARGLQIDPGTTTIVPKAHPPPATGP